MKAVRGLLQVAKGVDMDVDLDVDVEVRLHRCDVDNFCGMEK